jgi:NAD(P)-dependent dehydrogenase (short-subunit alcohol dehydrogenase family)
MQFSSMGGRVGGSAGIASYQAAKFAIDGFSRVLRAETAQFGIKVMVVEPSGFRTDWAGSSMTVRPIPEQYAEILAWRQEGGGVAAGDPDRAAEILVQVAKRRDIPCNLPLGVNATEGSIRLDQERLAEDRKWSAVSTSADFAESYPVEFPPDLPDTI